MTTTVDAVYENGKFQPSKPIDGLAEKARVKLIVIDAQDWPVAQPITDWESFAGGWPKEDLNDGFDETFEVWKKSHMVPESPDNE